MAPDHLAAEGLAGRLEQLRAAFASILGPRLSRITGKALSRVDMRAYAYREGHYLLPHTDHQDAVGRALAYAYYLPSPEPPDGGELELFRCTFEDGAVVATESTCLISPRANRLVVFDVSDASLHQVREVIRVRREEVRLTCLPDESMEQLAGRLAAGGSSPSARLQREELHQRLRTALERLAERDREVLIVRHLEQLSTREIAAVLEITEGAVKVRHVRALQRLRGLLGDLAEDLP